MFELSPPYTLPELSPLPTHPSANPLLFLPPPLFIYFLAGSSFRFAGHLFSHPYSPFSLPHFKILGKRNRVKRKMVVERLFFFFSNLHKGLPSNILFCGNGSGVFSEKRPATSVQCLPMDYSNIPFRVFPEFFFFLANGIVTYLSGWSINAKKEKKTKPH